MNRAGWWKLWMALAVAGACCSIARAELPNALSERGFNRDAAYDLGDLDAVNLFNGNLNLTIPLGHDYPVGPELSYRFGLTYSSRVWEYKYQQVCSSGYSQNEGWVTGSYYLDCMTLGVPRPDSNAGLGWKLSFGEIGRETPNSPYHFQTPDGSSHRFYKDLHASPLRPCDVASSTCYSRDGTYMRLRKVASDRWLVERTDGMIYELAGNVPGFAENGRWPVVRMEDRYGNWMTVDYRMDQSPPHWIVSDSHGRTHRVEFESLPASELDYQVRKVILETFDGSTATYDFTYRSDTLSTFALKPACVYPHSSETFVDVAYDLDVLTKVSLGSVPGWKFEFDYYTPQDDSQSVNPPPPESYCSNLAGRIRSVDLPTGGGTEWSYRFWGPYAMGSCNQSLPNPIVPVPVSGFSPSVYGQIGVASTRRYGTTRSVTLEKRVYEDGPWLGSLDTATTPDECPGVASASRSTVKSSVERVTLGNSKEARSIRFFSMYPFRESQGAEGWTTSEHGLPFTREADPPLIGLSNPYSLGGRNYYLSGIDYQCPAGGPVDDLSGCELLRSRWVDYERSGGHCLGAGPDCGALNHRLAGELTVYHDTQGKVASTEHTDFDGFGHYRQTVLGGSGFDPPTQRTLRTGYNWDRGSYSGGTLQIPGPGERWILDLFNQTSVEEGNAKAVVKYCHDEDGFLIGRRTLGANFTPGGGGAPAAEDLTVRYDRNAQGFRVMERFYGGDATANAADCKGAEPTAPEYQMRHTYAFGTRSGSWFLDSAGADFLKTLDLTIDPSTGLPSASTDTAGEVTELDYDALGRIVAIRPQSVPRASADVEVTYRTDVAPARVEVAQRDGSGTLLDQQIFCYDGIGRLSSTRQRHEEVVSAGAKWDTRWTEYFSTGQVKQVSEPVLSGVGGCPDDDTYPGSVAWTVYDEYDPFGRVGRVTPPDGPELRTHFSYDGITRVVRTDRIQTTPSGAPTPVTTEEGYDRHGRLVKVLDHSESPTGQTVTQYEYDLGDRLVKVSMANQVRTFFYDNRGFLVTEQHPELGRLCYRHDSLGNVVNRFFSDDATCPLPVPSAATAFDLDFRYDWAGRSTQVVERALEEPAKEYFYYRSGSEGGFGAYAEGRLVQTKRHNRVASRNNEGGAPVVVTETYTYGDAAGRITALETRASDGTVFRQGFSYDLLGNVDSLVYPECLYPQGCAQAAPPRTVQNEHSMGWLTRVIGFAHSFRYHPNGMWAEVTHSNGVQDRQSLYFDQLALTGEISTLGIGTGGDWTTGPYAYDGVRNPTTIGDSQGAGGMNRFVYDGVSRLVQATLESEGGSPLGTRTYTYDRFGNLLDLDDGNPSTTRPGAVDPATNRLLEVPGTIEYDRAGNLVLWLGALLEYDALDRVRQEIGPGINAEFLYNADDLRIGLRDYEVGETGEDSWRLRDLSDRVLRWVSVANDPADPSWSWRRDYVYRGDALLASVKPNGSGGERILHYHSDHLGTPRVITGPLAGRVATYEYWPFGELAEGTTDDDEILRFTGHERDFRCAEGACTTGAADDLDYMRARYYSPWIGRFLSVDPESGMPQRPQSWNRFSYAGNQPTVLIDPSGRSAEKKKTEETPDEAVADVPCRGCVVDDTITVVAQAPPQQLAPLSSLDPDRQEFIGPAPTPEERAREEDMRAAEDAVVMSLDRWRVINEMYAKDRLAYDLWEKAQRARRRALLRVWAWKAFAEAGQAAIEAAGTDYNTPGPGSPIEPMVREPPLVRWPTPFEVRIIRGGARR